MNRAVHIFVRLGDNDILWSSIVFEATLSAPPLPLPTTGMHGPDEPQFA